MDTIKEMAELLRAGKISWLEFAKELHKLSTNKRVTDLVSITGFGPKYVSGLINSYRFLEVRGMLGRDIKGSPTAIGLLPQAQKKLKERKREELFDDIVEKVIEGKMGRDTFMGIAEGKVDPVLDGPINAIKGHLKSLSYLLDAAIAECGDALIQANAGKECHEMALKLEGIFDPEFNEKKDFNL